MRRSPAFICPIDGGAGVPLYQPAQQSISLRLHPGLQLTQSYAPGLLACESVEQVLKLRNGIHVVLDRTDSPGEWWL